MREQQLTDLRLLIHESIEGTITEQGVRRLNEMLKNDSEIRQYYINYLNMQVILKNLYANEINIQLSNEKDVVNYLNAALEQLADDEKKAEPAVIETIRCAPKPLPVLMQRIEPAPRKINRTSWIAAVASFAALVLWAILAQYAPMEVAILEDSIDARWSNADLPLEPNSRFLTRQGPLILESGTVKFRFNNDARILVEAPAKFEIISVSEVRLHDGRIFARIPPEASGFTIASSASKIIDIGTDFGVQVDLSGATSLHVMKGLVKMLTGSGKGTGHNQVVAEKNAMRVSYDGLSIRPIDYNENAFVREISSADGFVWKGEPLDLVDIAKGGRGYETPSQFCMINPSTGQVEYSRDARLQYRLLTGYQPVPALPGVDGVFVPDTTDGSVQVSSMGHLFEGCPATSGMWFMPVLTEAIESAEFSSEEGNFKRVARPLVLQKHLFGTPHGRPALTLHANIGITFDLEAIRNFVPGTRITALSAMWGISEAAGKKEADSDFWILVDGQVRAHYNVLKSNRQSSPIVVQLDPADRFLTLTTTDGGDGMDNDWLVIAEPVLLIE